MPDLLARIDQIAALVAELRAELAGAEGSTIINADSAGDLAADGDFAEYNLIDPASAAVRFGLAQDTARKWCRETEGTGEAIGIRRGSRWRLSIPKLRRRLG
jgi:hypothetical protein